MRKRREGFSTLLKCVLLDAEYLKKYDGPELRIMEVCGTHTAAIFKNGIRGFLSPKIRLVSGPGCPVCVTPPSYVDRCIALAMKPKNTLVCFGDLMKVPGTARTLSDAAAGGGSVRVTYSPFDAIEFAAREPETIFTVAAIGFETTAPAYALLMEEAAARGLENLRLATALKSALSAMDWICASGEKIDAFLCPGHVSVVTGADAYAALAEKYGKPMVVTGFEGGRLLRAIRAAVSGAAARRGGVYNLYPEAVSAEGNARAREITERYFKLDAAVWRGLGRVENSGYVLRPEYGGYEANQGEADGETNDETGAGIPPGCLCGDVILGRVDPTDCPLFGAACTPARAAGPCMVSSEGACGVWYRGRDSA